MIEELLASIDPFNFEIQPAPLELILHQHRVATVIFQNENTYGVLHSIAG